MVRRTNPVQGVGTLQIKGHPRIELIRKTCLKSSERRISGLEILQRPGRSPLLELGSPSEPWDGSNTDKEFVFNMEGNIMSESYKEWTTGFRKNNPNLVFDKIAVEAIINESVSKMKTYAVKSMTQMSHGFWFAQGAVLAVVILLILF